MVEDFNHVIMDSQLPPGELNRLDKSVMGLEMCFGGGRTVRHVVNNTTQNEYDDAWIRDWTGDAEEREEGYAQRIDQLFGRSDEATNRLNELGEWNRDRQNEISGLEGDLSFLTERIDNWDTTTEIDEVVGLEDTLANLRDSYTTGQAEADERMQQRLTTLDQTLRDEFGSEIQALDIDQIRDQISQTGGDLGELTENFAGLSDDFDWIRQLDLGGLDDRMRTQGQDIRDELRGQGQAVREEFRGDLTNLRDILEGGRGQALSDLEGQVGRDRAADMLNLRQSLEEGRLTDIQSLAGSLRNEFGNRVFDLSDTFDRRLGGLQETLGGDVGQLFRKSGELSSGLDALTSGLGTTSQQLEALRDSFGDYQTDAATNLSNVRSAFDTQVGDLGTEFTSRLGDLQSSTARDILGLSQQTGRDIGSVRDALSGARQEAATGIAGARQEAATGIAGAREAAATGLAGLRSDVSAERQQALRDLDTTWSGRLAEQDRRFQERQQSSTEDFNRRLSDISASLNYKTLGDSAQGVKIRRSRAYQSGRTRAGTGQLGRSMKIGTLNI